MNKVARVAYVVQTLVLFSFYKFKNQEQKATTCILDRFMVLGGVYVKFLQMMVLHDDIHTAKYKSLRDALAVFDNVKPENLDSQMLLFHNLGSKAANIQIAKEPFAMGSFGQVYNGKIGDETEVIIKILRPSVKQNLSFDLSLMNLAVRVINFFRSNDFLNSTTLFSEFRQITQREADYTYEIQLASDMYDIYKHHAMIKIPKTYKEYSTREVIVQEKINGTTLTKFLELGKDDQAALLKAYDSNLEQIMEELAFEALNAVFNGDPTHGDPHPGNIILLPSNRVAFIDFGIVGEEVKRKKQLLNLIREYVNVYFGEFDAGRFTAKMVDFYVPELMNSLNVIGTSAGVDVKKKVAESMGDIVQGILHSSEFEDSANRLISKYQFSSLFYKVINANNRFSIQADLESVALMRSTFMFLELLSRLGLSQIVAGRAYRRVLTEQANIEDSSFVSVDAESLDRSLQVVSSWLDRLRYSDPVSYIKLQEVIA
jgi:tRNA A-37 threonylcarbamoyl transferase component Bud32